MNICVILLPIIPSPSEFIWIKLDPNKGQIRFLLGDWCLYGLFCALNTFVSTILNASLTMFFMKSNCNFQKFTPKAWFTFGLLNGVKKSFIHQMGFFYLHTWPFSKMCINDHSVFSEESSSIWKSLTSHFISFLSKAKNFLSGIIFIFFWGWFLGV